MLSWKWRVFVLVCLQLVLCFQFIDSRRLHRRHRRQHQQHHQRYDRRYNRVDVLPTTTTTTKPDTQLAEGM